MTKEKDIKEMFEWIENHPDLGKIDVCIPNAGFSANKSLLDGTMDEWRAMLDVNVLSLQLCTQLAIKSMLKVNKEKHISDICRVGRRLLTVHLK